MRPLSRSTRSAPSMISLGTLAWGLAGLVAPGALGAIASPPGVAGAPSSTACSVRVASCRCASLIRGSS